VKAAKKKRVWIALALCCLAGCSNDTANSLSRDYRNINNECVDGLMMVTSESRAKFVNEKIFKTYSDRVALIDKRAANYQQNTDDVQIIRETLNSESLAILFAEISANKKRMDLETARIRKIFDTRVKEHMDRFKAGGDKDAEARAKEETRKEWPNLSAFAEAHAQTTVAREWVKDNALATLVSKFPTKQWDGPRGRVPEFKELMEKFSEKIKKHQGQ
jgi:hypothetical protein